MIKSEMPAKPLKEKRRNNEKRKEKSRDAARCRRSRETEIFSDLACALPLAQDEVEQLDKASVMRLAISYLKVRSVVALFPELPPMKAKESEDKVPDDKLIIKELSYLKALDGFVLVISPDGDLIYLSENVSDYLGVSQMDLMGQSVFEFSHPCDHDEIREVLSLKNRSKKTEGSEKPKSFFIRLKCTLTSKGRNVNLKSASYKVIHCTGHLLTNDNTNMIEASKTQEVIKTESASKNPSIVDCIKAKSSSDDSSDSNSEEVKEVKPFKKIGSLVAVGRPIPHPSNIEVPLDSKTFLSKHSLDMKFTYADESMLEILGYDPQDLTGTSVYDYHHSVDSRALSHDFKCLFSKGQCETGRYRFLAKTGGYAWVLTQATLLLDRQAKPLSVVCVNYVISGVECRDEVLSFSQARAVGPRVRAAPAVPPRPQPATAKIFAPRTKDMNKGFLMFSEEEPGLTMLKEEPEDLTHLAPTAGDVCIPLEDNPFDMFDDFILGDNYCSLLPEEFGDLDPSQGQARPLADPFSSYRDGVDSSPLSDVSQSPLMMSPSVPKSPDVGSLPSLCSPGGSLPESPYSLTELSELCELSARAPYIPMGPAEPLPLLGAADGRVMWGALPEHFAMQLGARRPPAAPAPAPAHATPAPGFPPEPEKSALGEWRVEREAPEAPAKSEPAPVQPDSGGGDKPAERSPAGKRAGSPAGAAAAKRPRGRRAPPAAPPPPPAGSVLMNLLVSGCDEKSEVMHNSDNASEPLDTSYRKPLKLEYLELPFQKLLPGISNMTVNSIRSPGKGMLLSPQLASIDAKALSGNPFSNMLQCGSDPLLTTVLSQISPGSNLNGPSRKPTVSMLLDPDSSLFEEISPAEWNMGEEILLQGSDLLGEFDTPI